MGPKYRIERVRPEHVGELLLNVRHGDRLEFEALGLTPGQVIIQALNDSANSWSAFRDDELLCIFGVADRCILTGAGIPWMIGTKVLDDAAFGFLRRCRPAIQIMLDGYQSLENVVDARNTQAVKWLRWLGFHVHPAHPHGKNGEPFHYFEMRRPSDV